MSEKPATQKVSVSGIDALRRMGEDKAVGPATNADFIKRMAADGKVQSKLAEALALPGPMTQKRAIDAMFTYTKSESWTQLMQRTHLLGELLNQ